MAVGFYDLLCVCKYVGGLGLSILNIASFLCRGGLLRRLDGFSLCSGQNMLDVSLCVGHPFEHSLTLRAVLRGSHYENLRDGMPNTLNVPPRLPILDEVTSDPAGRTKLPWHWPNRKPDDLEYLPREKNCVPCPACFQNAAHLKHFRFISLVCQVRMDDPKAGQTFHSEQPGLVVLVIASFLLVLAVLFVVFLATVFWVVVVKIWLGCFLVPVWKLLACVCHITQTFDSEQVSGYCGIAECLLCGFAPYSFASDLMVVGLSGILPLLEHSYPRRFHLLLTLSSACQKLGATVSTMQHTFPWLLLGNIFTIFACCGLVVEIQIHLTANI